MGLHPFKKKENNGTAADNAALIESGVFIYPCSVHFKKKCQYSTVNTSQCLMCNKRILQNWKRERDHCITIACGGDRISSDKTHENLVQSANRQTNTWKKGKKKNKDDFLEYGYLNLTLTTEHHFFLSALLTVLFLMSSRTDSEQKCSFVTL